MGEGKRREKYMDFDAKRSLWDVDPISFFRR